VRIVSVPPIAAEIENDYIGTAAADQIEEARLDGFRAIATGHPSLRSPRYRQILSRKNNRRRGAHLRLTLILWRNLLSQIISSCDNQKCFETYLNSKDAFGIYSICLGSNLDLGAARLIKASGLYDN